MVIIMERFGVAGDTESIRGARLFPAVGIGERNHRTASLMEPGRVAPKMKTPLEPFHIAVPAFSDPADQRIVEGRHGRGSDPEGDETQGVGGFHHGHRPGAAPG
jgi:hypothetical protein